MAASFTFIHAADLHLGAPFRGLSESALNDLGKNAGSLLTEASYTALARLEALCLAEKADFLILAGDTYDEEDGILRARLALRDMFVRLEAAGITICMVHGNHDPVQNGLAVVRWPSSVTVFSHEGGTETLSRNGTPLACVHGISHATSKEKENLSLLLTRKETNLLTGDLFHIGILHCAVGGQSGGHAPYAPCTLGDLLKSGMDYWALGHVHQARILAQNPYVVYPGSLQGLHINEAGPHGCYVVRVENSVCAPRFVSLAPVLWQTAELDLERQYAQIQSMDELEQAILDHLDELSAAVQTESASGIFWRIVLSGRTELDLPLRRPDAATTLATRLRTAMHNDMLRQSDANNLRWYLKDISVRTAPALDIASMTQRQDIVGEVARIGLAAENNPELLHKLGDEVLHDMFAHRRFRKVLPLPDEKELADIAAQARALCCSMLEGE